MYIQLKGQIIYYEKTGEGSPIILAHGNGETHEIFDTLVSELSKQHTVYALDTRGHGQSASATEFHYNDMAEDIVNFIQALELVRPAFYGFSDGGIVGLIVASKYPALLSCIAISGANLTPAGCKFSFRFKERMRYLKKKDPLITLMLTEPNLSKKDLANISIPTLVLAGSKDIIKRKETKRIASAIPNATLNILKKETHSSYVVNSPKLFPILNAFFSKHYD